MAVLLIAEHNNKELRPFTLNAATAASQIDTDVHAVIIGQNSADAAKQLSELPVVKKVSGDITLMMSLTCDVSRSAAIRGIKFLPNVFAEQIM